MKRVLLALVTLSLLLGSTACHKHAYWDWYIEKEATCKEEGIKARECSCGDKETKAIPKIEHTPGAWIVDKEPTTQSTGKKHQVCAVCNETIKTVNIARLETGAEVEVNTTHEHIYGTWEVVDEATCTVEGKRVRRCTSCGEVLDVEEIAKKAHTYVKSTSGGSTVYKCSVCGASYTEAEAAKPLSVTVDQTGFASVFEGNVLHHELEFTATAKGGRGNLQYKFEIFSSKTASVATYTEGYSSKSVCVFESVDMDLTGLYVKVTVMDDAGSTVVGTYLVE